ncbi:MAG: PID-CTERM protein-sorting domain-containing protein [Flavobacteriaceae bacterium]
MKYRTLLLLVILLLACPLVFSQQPPAPQQPPPQLPVDGGVVALVLAGLFYGIKKSLKKK